MKFDMHCHTKEGSLDGKVMIEEYIRRLKEMGFGGMLVSDHNSYDGYREWKKMCIRDRVVESRIAESVICVDRRMTYTAVNRILTEKAPDLMKEYGDLVPMFFLMEELSGILRRNKMCIRDSGYTVQ